MDTVQTIRFSSTNTSNCQNVDDLNVGSGSLSLNNQTNSFSISNSEIVIKVDSTTHTSGSSAVVTRNITNYPWDLVYIPGNLVAVHSSGNFIAYAIIAPSSPNGIVRIISRRTGVRGLIKNIPGYIKDLAFAYLSNRVLLAFTDQYGTLFVYEVLEEEKTLRTQLLVEVKRNEEEEASDFQRVIWCPFIPDEPGEEEQEDGDEENLAYLLVVSNGPLAEIWHIMTLIQGHGTGVIEHSQVQPGPGHQVMEKHSAPISDAAFSPDGTALATASLDGYVKFFQVYMADNQNSPRCLHQWNPHDGKPLSCLFFLDNHRNPSPDVQFWKYAVTGACNNTEIKTWSCETWQCNQVIRFEMADSPNLDSTNLSLKAAIDPSSKFLVLSDIYRRVLYVLIVCQEPPHSERLSQSNGETLETGTPIHIAGKVGVARIVSISELPIQYPAIFLAITGAEWKPYKRWKHELGQDGFQEEQGEDMEEDADNIDIVEGLVLKSVLINTKSLQEATIRFQPALPISSAFDQLRVVSSGSNANHNLSASQDSIVIKDGLTDLSLNLSSTLSEMDTTSLAANLITSRQNNEGGLDNNSPLLVSFPCKPVSQSILGPDNGANVSVSAASVPISSLSCDRSEGKPGSCLTSPSLATRGGGSIGSPVDCGVTNQQPVTMNLLTPESFSSPGGGTGRTDEEELGGTKKEERGGGGGGIDATREPFPKQSPSPEDMKSAALSLLLRVNSGSRLQASERTSPSGGGTAFSPSSSSLPPSSSLPSSLPSSSLPSSSLPPQNILETVVAGSSRSPVNALPPPPRTRPSPLPSKDDAPLATSEVSCPSPHHPISSPPSATMLPSSALSGNGSSNLPHVGSGVGLASSTSSPSLEVQQILHSQNIKQEEFVDEEEDQLMRTAMAGLRGGGDPESQSEKSLSKASKCLIDLTKTAPSSLLNLTQPHLLNSTSSQPVASPSLLSNLPSKSSTSSNVPSDTSCRLTTSSSGLPSTGLQPAHMVATIIHKKQNLEHPNTGFEHSNTSGGHTRRSLEHPNNTGGGGSEEKKKYSSPQSQSLHEFINISAAASTKMEQASKGGAGKSPLLDMFEGLKIMPPPSTSQLSHLMLESGATATTTTTTTTTTATKKQKKSSSSPRLDDASRLVVKAEGTPVSSATAGFGQKKDSASNVLPLMKSLSGAKLHLTCEELEAEIKSSSPTTHKRKSSPTFIKSELPTTPPTTSLSGLVFPHHHGGGQTLSLNSSSSLSQNSGPVKAEKSDNGYAELENNRYEKTLEEIASLRQLVLSCDGEREDDIKALLDHSRTLSNQLDKSMKNLHQINKAIDELRKSQHKLHEQIPHLISTSAKSVIDNSVRQEIRNSLTPALNKCIEPIRSQLTSEIRNLVSNSEVHLSESLTKAACSRSFIDNLSASVASALSVSVQSACREAYNKVVVPGFNAITQQMFSQLNEAFTRGTKEYMQHVESESQTTRNALLENVSANSRTLESTSASLSTHVTVLMDALHKNLATQSTQSETLSDRLRHIVHDEIARAMLEHHAAVEARTSRAQTPASPATHPPINPKVARQQVQQLISQGQFNNAFKQALSASDLSLVVFVCERINPQQLFSQTPCPLSQDVLLSLVNQLSHDLTTFTDLKTKYLEEAVMNLDTAHPVTQEHMRKVLQEFQRCLSTHIEVNPNHKKLRMLLLAVNHLVAA